MVLSDAKYKGIDISCWNDDTIDWERVKAAGINFAIIRAGFGNSITQVDSHFKLYIEGALAAGMHIGVYWMSYAISVEDAAKEAYVFKQVIEPYSGKVDFPVGFDWEYDSEDYFVRQMGRHPSREEISNMCVSFCKEMEKDHWYAVNYQNIDYTKNKFIADTTKEIDTWLADYSGDPDFICGMQQIRSDGQIPGIDGNVDVDVAYKDYPAIIKEMHLNGYIVKTNVVAVTPDPIPIVVAPSITVGCKVVVNDPVDSDGVKNDLYYDQYDVIQISRDGTEALIGIGATPTSWFPISHLAKAGEAPAPAPVQNYRTYTTVPGDTLWGMASRFLGNGMRWPEIMALNGLSSSDIGTGVTFKIPN
jgi:GH25 family lysozyme M1 (1,4-beta-N-acetylmuramidase)